MSQLIANLHNKDKKKRNRQDLLALAPDKVYDDGLTKQSFKDETDIVKIMARFDHTGTISHVSKFEGVYADFSDFDFHAHSTRLAEGQVVFDALPAELRQEFRQDPQEFFAFVNHPDNVNAHDYNLPALAAPGKQLAAITTASADLSTATTAAATPATPTPPAPT